MALGENTISPLEIADARQAAHRASEVQREVEEMLRRASADLAEKERRYREKLSLRMVELHAEDGIAWTACGDIARGEEATAKLRYERDVAEGVLEAVRQQAFRRGADRRDLDTLLDWSKRRDLRVDTPPPDFDPATGEVREMPRAA